MKLSAHKQGKYWELFHGADEYRMHRTPSRVWMLEKNGEYVCDCSTKRQALSVANQMIAEAQEEIRQREHVKNLLFGIGIG